MKKKWLWLPLGLLGILLLGFGVLQLIPYGHDHQNPKVVLEPQWDSAETRALAQRTCFDCHSNETVWPWYSNVAPVSWLIQHDVDEGRQNLNFSEWDKFGNSYMADKIIEVLQDGEMPPALYLPIHPEANLTSEEKQQLLDGFRNSLP
jgi:hypothetical protein